MLKVIVVGAVLGVSYFWLYSSQRPVVQIEPLSTQSTTVPTQTVPQAISESKLSTPPPQKTLSSDYHVFQTFNNCGPAALSMALSYFGISITQQELGQELRPYQHPKGDNDDKSVTLAELAQKAKELGFTPYFRPNGSIDIIKYAIAYDLPVIVKTWQSEDIDTGHYRVVKGYNDTTQELLQDDSLQGKNLTYSYDDFAKIWKKYNYEYLLLVPADKVEVVEEFLGEHADESRAWELAVQQAKHSLIENPSDLDAHFNLVVALHNTGQYAQAVTEFEKISPQVNLKRLWYQLEPVSAYYEIGNYDKVLAITADILANGNRAYSEAYLLRGKSYLALDQPQLAQAEFAKALFYNANLQLD